MSPLVRLLLRAGFALALSLAAASVATARLAAPLAPAAAQTEEADQEPLPDGVVARLDGEDILRDDYLDFLYLRFGKRGVQEMIGGLLVEREAARHGITASPEEVAAAAEEREEASQRGLDQETFRANLRRNGQSYAMYRAQIEAEAREQILQRKLVLAMRVVTDQKIQDHFERKYGEGGVRMRVRHVLTMPNVLRAEKVRAGTAPGEVDMEEMRAQARAQAEQAQRRLAAGEDFAAVAAELSHDRVTKDAGGELQNYNGRLYGPDFRAALDALEPGGTSGVIESGAGFHVVRLEERTVTRMADVHDEIVEELMSAEPTFQEMSALRNGLIARADLRLF